MASVLGSLACPAPTLISANHASAVPSNALRSLLRQPSVVQCAREPGRYERCASTSRPPRRHGQAPPFGLAARTPMDRVVGLPRHRDMEVGHRILRRTGVTRPRGGCCDHRLVSGLPMGPQKIDLTVPADVRGEFASRTNWAWLLLGTLLTVGGLGATGAIVYDLSSGRAPMSVTFSPTSGSSSKAGRSRSSPRVLRRGTGTDPRLRPRPSCSSPVYCCSGTTSSHC